MTSFGRLQPYYMVILPHYRYMLLLGCLLSIGSCALRQGAVYHIAVIGCCFRFAEVSKSVAS